MTAWGQGGGGRSGSWKEKVTLKKVELVLYYYDVLKFRLGCEAWGNKIEEITLRVTGMNNTVKTRIKEHLFWGFRLILFMLFKVVLKLFLNQMHRHTNRWNHLMCKHNVLISNYWMRLSMISYTSLQLRQITQTRGFNNSWYHAKTKFNNCFIIHFST